MSEDLRKESEELFRYCGELTRRIGHGGITGVSSLVALYERLKQALDAVSAHELVWADERARTLIDKLAAVQASLAALRRLKAATQAPAEAWLSSLGENDAFDAWAQIKAGLFGKWHAGKTDAKTLLRFLVSEITFVRGVLEVSALQGITIAGDWDATPFPKEIRISRELTIPIQSSMSSRAPRT